MATIDQVARREEAVRLAVRAVNKIIPNDGSTFESLMQEFDDIEKDVLVEFVRLARGFE